MCPDVGRRGRLAGELECWVHVQVHERHPGSRAVDLGHDADRLRRPRLRGPPRLAQERRLILALSIGAAWGTLPRRRRHRRCMAGRAKAAPDVSRSRPYVVDGRKGANRLTWAARAQHAKRGIFMSMRLKLAAAAVVGFNRHARVRGDIEVLLYWRFR